MRKFSTTLRWLSLGAGLCLVVAFGVLPADGKHTFTHPDINRDGKVDILDLGILLSSWNATGSLQADLNQDNKVDILDLGILLSSWNAAIVAFNGNGFVPPSVTVQEGRSVIFINESSEGVWPASDPHPIHDAFPDLDPLHEIPPGGSYSVRFTQAGTWGYHDHLRDGFPVGTVIVQ